MAHELVKIIIFSHVIEMIAQDYHMSLEEARDSFYNSELIKSFSNDELGLYGQSPLYIYSLFKEEKDISLKN